MHEIVARDDLELWSRREGAIIGIDRRQRGDDGCVGAVLRERRFEVFRIDLGRFIDIGDDDDDLVRRVERIRVAVRRESSG